MPIGAQLIFSGLPIYLKRSKPFIKLLHFLFTVKITQMCTPSNLKLRVSKIYFQGKAIFAHECFQCLESGWLDHLHMFLYKPFIFHVKASLSFCPSISMSSRIGTSTSGCEAFSWITAGSWSSKLGKNGRTIIELDTADTRGKGGQIQGAGIRWAPGKILPWQEKELQGMLILSKGEQLLLWHILSVNFLSLFKITTTICLVKHHQCS